MTYDSLIAELSTLDLSLPESERFPLQDKTRVNFHYGHHLFKRLRMLTIFDFFLEELENKSWIISYQERGVTVFSKTFSDESLACNFFYVMIKRERLYRISIYSDDINDRINTYALFIKYLERYGVKIDLELNLLGVVPGIGAYGLREKDVAGFILLCKHTCSFIMGGDTILIHNDDFLVTGEGWLSLPRTNEPFRDYKKRTWNDSLVFVSNYHNILGETLYLFLVGK